MKLTYIDDEEKRLIEEVKATKWVVSPNSEELKKQLEEAARKHMAKKERINIRISEADLALLKIKAAEEGLPYQTLIASVLHKYVSGQQINP